MMTVLTVLTWPNTRGECKRRGALFCFVHEELATGMHRNLVFFRFQKKTKNSKVPKERVFSNFVNLFSLSIRVGYNDKDGALEPLTP